MGSNPSSSAINSVDYAESLPPDSECDGGSVCRSVCIPPDEGALMAAIDRLTRALATADDVSVPELVAERRAMREELAAMRERDADVVRLEDERAQKGPRR